MKAGKALSNIFKNHRLPVIVAITLLLISSLIETTATLSLSPVIDLIVGNNSAGADSVINQKIYQSIESFGIKANLTTVLILFGFMTILKNIILSLAKYSTEKIHNSIMHQLITNIFTSFMNSHYNFFQKRDIGILSNTILKETDQVSSAIQKLALWFSNALRATFFLILCLSLSAKLTITVIFFMCITLFPFLLLNKISYRYGQAYTNAANNLQSLMIETFGGVKLILAHGRIKASLERLKGFLHQYMSSAFRLCLIRGISPLVYEPIGVFIVILAIYLGKTYYSIPASSLLIILYSLRMFTSLASQLVTERNAILSLAPSIEQTFMLMHEAKMQARSDHGKEFHSIKKSIQFKNIEFHYPHSDKNILNQINLTIKQGERIAFIGPSGSGKTTLIDLILRLQDATSGTIEVDGEALTHFHHQSWSNQIALVPQDPILFNASIKDNLLWANPDASSADIEKALMQSNATEFVMKLNNKLDYIVGDRGNKLSGGQRQRIALARALIRNPQILILDEATSNLDHQSGKLIEDALLNLDRSTTIIMIAHQIDTIKKFDRIAIMESGKIKSIGTFSEVSLLVNSFLNNLQPTQTT